MSATELTERLREFLKGNKVSEQLDSDLRSAIGVETGLERALVGALEDRRNVIIAGSAGGGKTHLLHRVWAESLDESHVCRWGREEEPENDEFVRIVPDATAVPEASRLGLLEEVPDNCICVAIAINEGPLLHLAREHPESGYSSAVEYLHQAQRGRALELQEDQPVVLDVGGYDPIEDGVIGRLVGLPVLNNLVEECDCGDPDTCYRRKAWSLLEAPKVRDRLNDLLHLVKMQGRPVLFRQLWNFIDDIATGGSCDGRPPTSPWYWRVFYGDSQLSVRLREVADPELAVYPRVEAQLYHGNYRGEEVALADQVKRLLSPPSPAPHSDDATYQWLKSQMFFVGGGSSMLEIMRGQVDLKLKTAVEERQTERIVAALNDYMTYGTLDEVRGELKLWTDFGVDHRTDRVEGQVSLGGIDARDLEVRQSYAVTNHHREDCILKGFRRFLVHDSANASFALTPEVLNLLSGGRSYRTSDRHHTDLEWYLKEFYTALASQTRYDDRMSVLDLDFDSMQGSEQEYHILPELGQIEFSGR